MMLMTITHEAKVELKPAGIIWIVAERETMEPVGGWHMCEICHDILKADTDDSTDEEAECL